MKRLLILFLTIFFTLPILVSCTSGDDGPITADKAKSIILKHTPEAVITDCTYNEDTFSYIITFNTSYGSYEGIVTGFDGKLTSVSVKEERSEITEFENYPEEDVEHFISIDTALTIALSNSGISGTAIITRQDLNRTEKVFRITLRSGNTEYSYIIDAVTGDIISSEAIQNS